MITDHIPVLFSTENLLEMFRSGMDTHDIAKSLGLREADVYNLMRPAEILKHRETSNKGREQWQRTKKLNARLREASRIAGPVDGSG